MTAQTCQIRFMDNNYNDEDASNVVITSTGVNASNARNLRRSSEWEYSGNFVITSTTNKIYINDGSDKTVTLTAGEYTSGALDSHLTAQLNGVSSGWSVSYSSSTNRWTISRSSSATLRFSQTTDAAWDVFGFVLPPADVLGTSWVGNQQRIHTYDWYKLDLIQSMEVTFVGVIGPIDRAFDVNQSGSIYIEANDIDLWDSPPLSRQLTLSDRGAFVFLDDISDTIYRFWRLKVVDPMNPRGHGLIGHIYIGDHKTLTTTNISRGFSKQKVDGSNVVYSLNGSSYANIAPKFRAFRSMNIDNIPGDQHRDMEQLFHDLGVGRPFYVSLDPMLKVSSTLDEMTFFAKFDGEPEINHLFKDYYRWGFELREVV